MTRIAKMVFGAALIAGAAGCMNLEVSNLNSPDRDRALSSGQDVEALISGTFRTWWDLQQGRAPGPALASAADEHSPAAANYGHWDTGQEPRIPVVNISDYTWNYYVNDPWFLLNRALASLRDALQSIEGGVQVGANGVDTPRALAFAKFMQALGHAQIGILYDQGVIIDETVADVSAVAFKPYPEVMAAARGYFIAARDLATQNTFTIPATWMGAGGYTNQDLIRLTHSYEARLMTEVARTPQERAAVKWDEVLSHIGQGVTRDFGIEITGPGQQWSYDMKNLSTLDQNFDQALVGRADQSGRWQAYEATPGRDKLPFVVDTDDLRIGTPTRQGTLVQYRTNLTGDPQRGTMFLSYYSPRHWRALADFDRGFAPDLTVQEIDYLRAEAYIRLAQPDLALPIINKNRVDLGGLPPATVDGVVGQARCVPRTHRGQCGDLLYTLAYEKALHSVYLSQGSIYYDARGFGTLREGTFLHLPVPARDLMSLQMEAYTFGGVGGVAAAPAWP